MKNLILLSKENIELSRAEAIAALGIKRHKALGNSMIFDGKKKGLERLAYTKASFKVLFESDEKDLENDMKRFNWQKRIKGSYCVRFLEEGKGSISSIEKRLGSMIWYKVKNPRINLEDPKTKIMFLKFGKKIFCCLPMWEQTERFELRNPNFLPEFKPIVLKTRLARAVVNLTGAGRRDTVLDPFCGIGGLLIEAGLIGCKVKGYDIDPIAIYKCRRNLEHNRIKDFFLRRKDSTMLDEKADYIITDFPYGKNTKKQDLESLYLNFLKVLKKTMRKRAVIIFPDFVDYRKMIKAAKLSMKGEFTVYVHKSLSRKIVILER